MESTGTVALLDEVSESSVVALAGEAGALWVSAGGVVGAAALTADVSSAGSKATGCPPLGVSEQPARPEATRSEAKQKVARYTRETIIRIS